jgi:dTDP-4-dehydrorhamnose reductase
MTTKRILILGATGMLGHSLFTRFSEQSNVAAYATARDQAGLSQWFSPELVKRILVNVDADNLSSMQRALAEIKPDIVINCIGIIKQLPVAKDPLISITINALFPHQLAHACKDVGARMIHISTDCVFSGKKGEYTEQDFPDADDLYGRTKLLGEVAYPHCVTLRTSIIGHELKGQHGLIEWFLAQEGKVRGFTKAIYSGFPTGEIGNIISDYVIPNKELGGLYHVSSDPISKYDLLRLVAERYGKKIEIESYADFVLDRSLDSKRFREATGYRPPEWPELVEAMYRDFKNRTW